MQRTGTFEGFTVQIIRQEIDHCDEILILGGSTDEKS